jgi:hypothetical protein
MVSKNQAYCLKNIVEEEFNTLGNLFKDYCEFKATEKDIILVPILAVLLLRTEAANNYKSVDPFILMPNLNSPGLTVFDIKGHCDHRLVEASDFRDFGFGKDENFMKSEHRKVLKKSPEPLKKEFLRKVEKTVVFLRKHNIIDYSLMLIFC